ncbi:MAG: c-type cytochrome [Gammaproteobacteria bacterium]|nr:c-type cytochrome [Gammaproteobacteria bacterium]MDH5692904.1 c-type cytochrome [Gammaproteobacteria bacterium]
MQRLATALTAAAFILGTMVPSIAMSSAQYPRGNGDINNGKAIFDNGKGDVPACSSCHGADGMGDDNMGTPRIAGQFAIFLRKQLEDFATDKRMDTTMFVMNANAKGLSPKDRNDVATYLESIKPKTSNFKGSDLKAIKEAGTVPVGQTHKGKSLVEWGQGNRAKPVPACKACHGYNGRGAPPVYPRIGGQRYVYLVNQLKKWRDGTRANDPMSQMQKVARNMSDEDIYNAAAYLTKASDYSDGNFFTPYDRH